MVKGPDFLKEPVEIWLKEETYEEHVDADSPEVKDFKFNASAVKENSDILKRLKKVKFWQRRRHPAKEHLKKGQSMVHP